jgi:tetraprenyl-beta-curcumene synthase
MDGDLPLGDDGGYLRALTLTCRAGCATLPHYRAARGLLVREARRSRAFEIEHDGDPQRRVQAMQQFAAREFSDTTDATWWELTGGASSLLTAMAVLALAADEQTTGEDLRRSAEAYTWVANAAALLDSYADQLDDARTGAHNWLDYYPAKNLAVQRTAVVIDRALRETSALRNGDRHLVIVTSMIALALSSDSARSPSLRASSHALEAASGSLTRLLIPVLRAWRIAHRQPDG